MKTYGLIGYPLSHSFSKKYFTEKFEHEGIKDVLYELFPIENIQQDFRKFLNGNLAVCGLNVTIPHKQTIIQELDALDETAQAVGAVNCIKFISGKGSDLKSQISNPFLIGYNTDVYGFEMSLKKFLKPYHTSALILGSGGAAKAVHYVLKKLGISFQFVRQDKHVGPEIFTYNQLLKEHIQSNLLIINATPVGTFPNVNNAPEIPYQHLTTQHLLFDMVYNPAETLFLKKGKTKGASTVNGLDMLYLQAERAWKIWNTPS